MRFLLPLFICLSCWAQLPVIPFVTQPTAGPDIPTSIGGLGFWIESSDLTASNNVATWIDRVHNVIYTNNSSSTQPTNAGPLGFGVWFKTGSFLMVSNYNQSLPLFQSTNQIMIVWQPHQGPSPEFNSIIGSSSGESLIGNLTLPSEFGSYAPQRGWAIPTPVDDVFHDIISVGGQVDSTANNVQMYTNGVAAQNVKIGFSTLLADRLGDNQSGHIDRYQGYVRRIIVWTNATAFTTAQVSNLHYFNTNEATINAALYFSP